MGIIARQRWVISALTIALATALTPSAAAAEFKVIVNKDNPLTTITVSELSKIFLRETTSWSDGSSAQPIDLAPDSAVRAAFSERVHGRDVPAVKSYWQRQIFSGRAVPPVEFSSEKDVVDYVAQVPGAVGYVDASIALAGSVKVLELRD